MVDRDGSVVFVEVKTRADEGFAPAYTAVTGAKQQKLIRTAKYFLALHDISDRPCRFDVVTVVLGERGAAKIEHFENAFKP